MFFNLFQTLALIYLLVACVNSTKEFSHPASVYVREEPKETNLLYQSRSAFVRTLKCGGVYSSTNGGFSHKPFQTILENERCGWVIGVPGAVGYTIHVQLLGSPTNVPESGQELVLTGVRYNGNRAPILTSYLPTSAGSFTISNANIVVVTFSSGTLTDRLSRGFALRYQDIQFGNITKTSLESTHVVMESITAEYRYPPTSTTYKLLELAAFLFPPVGNFYANRAKHVLYQRLSLDPSCYDSLFIYTFQNGREPDDGKWLYTGRICQNNVTSLDIPDDDMVLVLFQSASSRSYAGFNFSFLGC